MLYIAEWLKWWRSTSRASRVSCDCRILWNWRQIYIRWLMRPATFCGLKFWAI